MKVYQAKFEKANKNWDFQVTTLVSLEVKLKK